MQSNLADFCSTIVLLNKLRRNASGNMDGWMILFKATAHVIKKFNIKFSLPVLDLESSTKKFDPENKE